jgi:hypothetical protein
MLKRLNCHVWAQRQGKARQARARVCVCVCVCVCVGGCGRDATRDYLEKSRLAQRSTLRGWELIQIMSTEKLPQCPFLKLVDVLALSHSHSHITLPWRALWRRRAPPTASASGAWCRPWRVYWFPFEPRRLQTALSSHWDNHIFVAVDAVFTPVGRRLSRDAANCAWYGRSRRACSRGRFLLFCTPEKRLH